MNKNPIIPFLLIIFLGVGLVFLLSSQGANMDEEEGEEVATEEGSEEGDGEEESGEGEEGASTGDVDAEGVAQNSCASCHGEDFSGGMGPALEGTSLGEDEFTDIVRNGQGSMPAFSEDEVSDEELTAMYEMFSE